MGEESNPAADDVARVAPWRRTRLASAFLLLVVYAVAAIWWYRECSTFIAGSEPPESTCAQPTISSATVVVLLLLVLLLLWPDISEITVLGVSLKRKVEQAKQAAADAKTEAVEAQDDIRDLSAAVQSLQLQLNTVVMTTASSSSAATISQTFLVPERPWSAGTSADVKRSVMNLQRERNRYDSVDSWSQAPRRDRVNLEAVREGIRGKSDDELKMQLLRDWETLDSILGITTSARPRATKSIDDDEPQLRSVQQSFIADHRDTLSGVRSLRNAVAHAKDVSRHDVEDGLEALALLQPLAEDWLRAYSAPPAR